MCAVIQQCHDITITKHYFKFMYIYTVWRKLKMSELGA